MTESLTTFNERPTIFGVTDSPTFATGELTFVTEAATTTTEAKVVRLIVGSPDYKVDMTKKCYLS